MDPRVPDFFLVGAARSGTTTLSGSLKRHPAIEIPYKEPSYFSDLPNPRRSDLASYLRLYRGIPRDRRLGDASTMYLPSMRAAGRIHELNPGARIMMVLRNPVDRAYSLYWHKVRSYTETLSFEAALDAEPERVRQGWPLGNRYVATGLYADQVERFLDRFGPERVRIDLFEDLKRDLPGLCRALFSFLEVDPGHPVAVHWSNRAGPFRSDMSARLLSWRLPGRRWLRRIVPERIRLAKRGLQRRNVVAPPPMDPATRARLVERFAPDVERLERILSRDLSAWRERPAAPETDADDPCR